MSSRMRTGLDFQVLMSRMNNEIFMYFHGCLKLRKDYGWIELELDTNWLSRHANTNLNFDQNRNIIITHYTSTAIIFLVRFFSFFYPIRVNNKCTSWTTVRHARALITPPQVFSCRSHLNIVPRDIVILNENVTASDYLYQIRERVR